MKSSQEFIGILYLRNESSPNIQKIRINKRFMKRPTILWITSRSRSSLVAKIFLNHGLWSDDPVSFGSSYPSYENEYLKSLQKKYNNNFLPVMKETKESDSFVEDVKRYVGSRNCCFKTGIEHFNMWKAFEPYNIFIRRDLSEVVNSLKRKKPDIDVESARKVAQWRYQYMDKCKELYGGVNVDTGKIINGDYEEVYKALEYCNIKPNDELISKSVSK